MSQITFEDRAVAFIDVLGFKNIVNRATTGGPAFQKLQRLIEHLDEAVPELDALITGEDARRLIPTHTYISDCIILSAPVSDPNHRFQSYDGLAVVVMRAIQLSHRFFTEGYLLRGGISLGKVWHQPSNIVGPAYQEACGIEQTTDWPRIALSDSAKRHWCMHSSRLGGRMCREYDGVLMVNGLHEAYARLNSQREPTVAYGLYAATAAQMIADPNLQAKYKAKWQWFESYLRDERGANGY
jgi:hypothetical protein